MPLKRIRSKKRVPSSTLLCALWLMMNAVSSSAQADVPADSERANLLFKKGKFAFNAGKFNDALRIYTEAWGLKKSPDIAANLAQTESELGKHREAAEHFAFALAHMLPSSTDDQKFALADGLEAEKKEIGTLRFTLEPADSTLAIDDAPVTVPTTGEVYVEPGEHRIAVTHEGYETHLQTLSVDRAVAQVLWIKLDQPGAQPPAVTAAPSAPASEAPPPSVDESSSRSIVPAIVGGGLVVAGSAVGVVFLLSGNSSQNDADALFQKLPPGNVCGSPSYAADCAALHSKNADIDSARRIEVIGFSVAGAAAVGTVLYLLWPRSESSTANHWAPSLAFAPGAGSVGLTARF